MNETEARDRTPFYFFWVCVRRLPLALCPFVLNAGKAKREEKERSPPFLFSPLCPPLCTHTHRVHIQQTHSLSTGLDSTLSSLLFSSTQMHVLFPSSEEQPCELVVPVWVAQPISAAFTPLTTGAHRDARLTIHSNNNQNKDRRWTDSTHISFSAECPGPNDNMLPLKVSLGCGD